MVGRDSNVPASSSGAAGSSCVTANKAATRLRSAVETVKSTCRGRRSAPARSVVSAMVASSSRRARLPPPGANVPLIVNGVSAALPEASTVPTPRGSVRSSSAVTATRNSSRSGRRSRTSRLSRDATSTTTGRPSESAVSCGGVARGSVQFASPASFCSSNTATSCNSSFLIRIGPDTSDHSPTSTASRPADSIGSDAPQLAFAKVTSVATSAGRGSTSRSKSPPIRNSRPRTSLTIASSRGRKRLERPASER